GAGIAAITDSAKQSQGGWRLAVAGAVVDVIRADHGARQFLHQITLFVGALRRRNEGERVRPMLPFDLVEFARHQVEGLVPTGFAEPVTQANQRLGQTVRIVDIVPSELPFDAGGDSVRGALGRLDFQDMAVFGPDVEAATDSTIRAHGLRAADEGLAHSRFHFGDSQDGAVSSFRFDALDDVDHAVQRALGNPREESRVPEHGLFHQGIAGADGDAVATGAATGVTDKRTAVPANAGVRIFPVNDRGFIDLDVLTDLYAPATENALIGIVTKERI